MISRITGGPTTELFTATVLRKYPVRYFRCNETGFIQTEQPYWLSEAYASAISSLDVGHVQRNLDCRDFTERVLLSVRPNVGPCLDYGGGYGLLVRLMRDRGFNFYREDPHCQNIFAGCFDTSSPEAPSHFDAVTAFEVLEHVPDPLETFATLLERADLVICSTELQPEDKDVRSVDDWWYFLPDCGQHISLYNRRTLAWIADHFGVHFYTDGRGRHVFSRHPLHDDPFQVSRRGRIRRKLRQCAMFALAAMTRKQGSLAAKHRESLIATDFELVSRGYGDDSVLQVGESASQKPIGSGVSRPQV